MPLDILIQVGPARAEPEATGERAVRLATELREYGIDVTTATKRVAAGAGSRGDPATVLGALLVAVASRGAFTELVAILRDWVNRNNTHTITMKAGSDEITITGRQTARDEALIEEFRRKLKLP